MEVNVSGELIKLLRSQRSWSQEELATVSGLSVRTVQRIEKSGSCSLESQKALASVFEVKARSLGIDDQATAFAIQNNKGKRYGFCRAAVGLLCGFFAITYSWWLTGNMSEGTAGIYSGVTGAFGGICVAVVGIMSRIEERRQD